MWSFLIRLWNKNMSVTVMSAEKKPCDQIQRSHRKMVLEKSNRSSILSGSLLKRPSLKMCYCFVILKRSWCNRLVFHMNSALNDSSPPWKHIWSLIFFIDIDITIERKKTCFLQAQPFFNLFCICAIHTLISAMLQYLGR